MRIESIIEKLALQFQPIYMVLKTTMMTAPTPSANALRLDCPSFKRVAANAANTAIIGKRRSSHALWFVMVGMKGAKAIITAAAINSPAWQENLRVIAANMTNPSNNTMKTPSTQKSYPIKGEMTARALPAKS